MIFRDFYHVFRTYFFYKNDYANFFESS